MGARRSILISGGTGSGKTTLLNALGKIVLSKVFLDRQPVLDAAGLSS